MIFEQLREMAQPVHDELEISKYQIRVCIAAGCVAEGSDLLLKAFQDEVKSRNLSDMILVKGVGCMGPCSGAPLVKIAPNNVMYNKVKPEDVSEILSNLANLELEPVQRIHLPTDTSFFTRQKLIVLENSGKIEPERLEDYLAHDGYQALAKVLTSMSQSKVIDEIMKSGLRGRGGAGYPTGLKWQTVSKAGTTRKFVICNADEGDPGAFMDRSVLESDPHRILEGMAIAGYAVGASEGFIYVRAEYPLAIKRLKKAIRQAEAAGILGKQALGTTFNFHIDVRLGAGAFVCGEETALITSISGHRGYPRTRPPYPAEYGLWGYPTLINNVETFANVPSIIRYGSDWYSAIGTDTSKGTKVFALAGKILNTGLIEVPMGITLREIIYDIGGGIPNGRKFKAVQTGGPSGGCIPEEFLDLPIDYESLAKMGSIIGSGGMIIIDDTANMVDFARYFMDFCMSESCGKCAPCRVGTVQMHNILDRMLNHKASSTDMKMLEELCDLLKTCSLCGLGQTAPNPVLSTLKYFREEYDMLIRQSAALSGGER
jgi:bidirectional [NiFe] hydrogenase diaphorase subunit